MPSSSVYALLYPICNWYTFDNPTTQHPNKVILSIFVAMFIDDIPRCLNLPAMSYSTSSLRNSLRNTYLIFVQVSGCGLSSCRAKARLCLKETPSQITSSIFFSSIYGWNWKCIDRLPIKTN